MKSISERMKEALELRNMKQADLVEATGIGKSSISTYLSGDYEPKQRNIYKIAKALDVSEPWLMGYDVPMERQLGDSQLLDAYLKSVPDCRDELTKSLINSRLTNGIDFEPVDIELLAEFKKLNNTGKKEAVNRVTELTYIPQYTEPNIISLEEKKESKKKKYEPTEEDIKSLVARNGKKITREQAYELVSLLFSEDEDEE